MDSRQRILAKLNRLNQPFPGIESPEIYLSMVPAEEGTADLVHLFSEKARGAGCLVHRPDSDEEAVRQILKIVGTDPTISCWDKSQIPLPGLAEALAKAEISCVGQDASVRVGLTGADAALAATGSLVLSSGEGRFRASSLLPPVHVAVLNQSQILPDLESWFSQQRVKGLEGLRQSSNIVIVTGPSRTADIALQLVMGMHGPRAVHIVLVGKAG